MDHNYVLMSSWTMIHGKSDFISKKTPAKSFTPKFRSQNHSFLSKIDIFCAQSMENVDFMLKMSDFMINKA